MKAFELIVLLKSVKKVTAGLGGYQYFENINNKSSSEISELIEGIKEDLNQVEFASSKTKK